MSDRPLNRVEAVFKIALDYVVAAPSLLALLPLIILLGLLVKLDSPGPAFHRRRVMGKGGKIFFAYKIRTMRADSDELSRGRAEFSSRFDASPKSKSDPRVTRIGRWLRSCSLDELPQLVNVIRGQMSLVGPRMIHPTELDRYGCSGGVLLSVKPGITGPWQVSGRSDLSGEERVRLDLDYVFHYSIGRDLRILFLETLPAVWSRRGAY